LRSPSRLARPFLSTLNQSSLCMWLSLGGVDVVSLLAKVLAPPYHNTRFP
jgi:hypothetical protein